MPNMLLVPAFKIGDPIQGLIQMKPDDLAGSPYDFCLQGFHMEASR
jgi:hypothetical protein